MNTAVAAAVLLMGYATNVQRRYARGKTKYYSPPPLCLNVIIVSFAFSLLKSDGCFVRSR